ncbi:hypothetical protein ACH41H_24285 [Streptomyces sp. NPDC020800]|uniref:hypothetical protein n=1 Tax=Streptomyces sp. NPDC020800 TaxID=3365092 RepID=UPI0037A45EE0
MTDLSTPPNSSTAPDPLRSVYLRLVAAQSIPEEAREQFTYLRRLAPDLLAGIALDTAEHVRLLDDREVRLVDWSTLLAAGSANLLAEPVDYNTITLPEGAVLHLLGHPESVFAASKVLLFEEAVRAARGPELPEEGVLLVVPNRHNLAFYPLSDRHVGEAVNTLAQFAQGAYMDGPGELSPRVFWWRAGELVSITAFDRQTGVMSIEPPDELMTILRRLAHPGS